MNGSREELASVSPGERVLLLSHCLRPSQSCTGRFTKEGLLCPDGCELDCIVGRLRKAAITCGYKGICVAAGGSMALRFVQAHRPLGVVAVACRHELTEGLDAAKATIPDDTDLPSYVMVPLITDGCVDTEVNESEVLAAIYAGCGGPAP